MKAIVLVLFLGAATAFPDHAMQHACNGLVRDFKRGMDKAPSLRSVMNLPHMTELDILENDIKTGLGEILKKLLDDLMGHMKDMYDRHQEIQQDFYERFAKVLQLLKDFGIDLKEHLKNLINELHGKVKDRLIEIYNRIFNKETNETNASMKLAKSLDVKDLLKEIKEKIVEKLDVETIVNYIRERFGNYKELSEKLIEAIRKGGKDLLKALLDMILHHGQRGPEHGIADMWEKVKDFFNNLGLEIKAKWAIFGDWVETVMGKGLEAIKDRVPKIKAIAEMLIDAAKEHVLKKDVAIQALEFMKLYKDDLGGDLFEKLVTILQKYLQE